MASFNDFNHKLAHTPTRTRTLARTHMDRQGHEHIDSLLTDRPSRNYSWQPTHVSCLSIAHYIGTLISWHWVAVVEGALSTTTEYIPLFPKGPCHGQPTTTAIQTKGPHSPIHAITRSNILLSFSPAPKKQVILMHLFFLGITSQFMIIKLINVNTN